MSLLGMFFIGTVCGFLVGYGLCAILVMGRDDEEGSDER